jgi:hypothetical protein
MCLQCIQEQFGLHDLCRGQLPVGYTSPRYNRNFILLPFYWRWHCSLVPSVKMTSNSFTVISF